MNHMLFSPVHASATTHPTPHGSSAHSTTTPMTHHSSSEKDTASAGHSTSHAPPVGSSSPPSPPSPSSQAKSSNTSCNNNQNNNPFSRLPETSQPRKASFHHLTPRQEHKVFLRPRQSHHIQSYIIKYRIPFRLLTQVTLIDKHNLYRIMSHLLNHFR